MQFKTPYLLPHTLSTAKFRTRLESLFWAPYTHLFIKGDHANWSLYWDAVELSTISRKLGIPVVEGKPKGIVNNQCYFNMSRYEILKNWKTPRHRIAFPYYHGNPENDEESRRMLLTIRKHHRDIDRIQVSCRFMEAILLDTGIDPSKVFRIPIGINRKFFSPATMDLKIMARTVLGIPMNAVVVGSFQKDGNGWEEGLTPKMVKGPDIFIKTIEILKKSVPELFVLLTGPARGYVRNGLEKLNVSYVHKYLNDYTEISRYYHALDIYIVSSRDEGGPKAVLESMACGIPLISTKVGQATDLVKQGENGFLAEIGDAESLAHYALKIIENMQLRMTIIKMGLETATANDYENQLPLWAAFMSGFVNVKSPDPRIK